MRKLSSLLIALVACITFANAETINGTCGDNLTWELSCDSVLTISGSGAMTSAPWIKSYKTAIKNAIIEDGVTNVYWAAFYYCSNLKSVTIGNSVTQIEGYAFYECTGLTSVTIPNKVIGIGNSAFSGCRGLTTISLPNSLTTIEDWAFSNCRVLTSVTIPQNVDSIGQAAFGGCFSLIEINVVSENSHFCSVDGVVFNKAMTTLVQYPGGVQGDYIIPNSVTAVAWGAFWNCPNMTGIKIPSGVTSLGERGFSACKGLTSITCEAVTPPTCGTEEFYGVDKSIPVYVPAESVNAYKSASYWNEFTNIQPICETIETEETIYLCSGTTLMWYGMSYSGSGDYTQTLVTIHGCDSIVTLHLIELPLLTGDTTAFITKGSSFIWHGVSFTAENTPATHAYISKNTPECDSIVTLHIIEIEDPAPCLKASGTCGAEGDNLTWTLSCDSVLTISGTGAMYEYYWNTPWMEYKDEVRYVIVEEGVTTIGATAFRDFIHLRQCSLPSTLISIGEEAFCFCFQLMSVDIPQSCTTISGWGAFNLVPNVNIQDESIAKNCAARSINGYVEGYFVYADKSKRSLRACSSIAKGYVALDDAIERIEYMAFAQCEEITNLQFGSHLQYIGEWSLNGCIGLEGLRFQEGLKEIASNAFGNCFGLQYVYLPNSLTTLGDFAIGNCPVLRTIHLGDSLRNVGSQIFDSCQGIDTIYATMTTPPVLDNTAFAASNLPGITCYVPKASLSLYQQAPVWSSMNLKAIGSFDPEPCILASGKCGDNLTWELSCNRVLTISGTGEMADYTWNTIPWKDYSIDSLVIEEGVTRIGNNAFDGCGIKSVILPNSVLSIGDCAFLSCYNLADITVGEQLQKIGKNAFYKVNSSQVHWNAIACTDVPSSGIFAYMATGVSNIIFGDKVRVIPNNFMRRAGENITELIIPENVEEIGDSAFCSCSEKLLAIYNYADSPQAINSPVFDGVNKTSCSLYVPGPSLDLYRAADGWKDFTNIQPIEGTFPVTFLDYNGEVLSEQNVAYNQAAAAPEVPAREGYTFSGWSTDIEHIVARTFAIALYDKIGGTLTYLSEEGDVIATENVDLHLPAAPIIAGKSFKGWLTESADAENGIVLRATYTSDNPTTHDDVTITPSSNSAYVIFPFITGALTYQLVIRDLFGNVVCKIMFSATGHLLGVAFAPSRNRESQQATQTTGFNFTVEGLDANTTYEYEFVANDDTDEVIETLSGSFTTTAEVPTDNEQVNSPSAVRKYLDDGHLMIDANSHIFNTQGKMIK